MSMPVRGTLLQRYVSGSWETIAGVQNLNTGAENEQVDLTTIADPARMRKPALLNVGPWSFTLLFDDSFASHNHIAGLKADFLAGTQRDYRVLFTTGKYEQANASVQNASEAFQIGDHIKMSVQLAINGTVLYG